MERNPRNKSKDDEGGGGRKSTGATGEGPSEFPLERKKTPIIGKPLGRIQTVKTVDQTKFRVYRDDDTDVFKPISVEAVNRLGSTAPQLTYDEKNVIHAVASNLQRSISMEYIFDEPPMPALPEEIREEINKMPSWLGAMIKYRFVKIQQYFKEDTLKFLKDVNEKIDNEYRPEFAYFEGIVKNAEGEEDSKDNEIISAISSEKPETPSKDTLAAEPQRNLVFQVTETIGNWDRTQRNAKHWHPRLVHSVSKKLRSDLTMKPSPVDVALANQDVIHKHNHSDSEDSDFDEFGRPKWEVIRRKEIAEKQAEMEMDLEMSKSSKNRKMPYYIKERKSNKKEKKVKKQEMKRRKKRKRKAMGRIAMRRQLFARGHFRRHSRLLHTKCGQKSDRPRRLEYRTRDDDSFHHYIVTLVTSHWFRNMIMIIVILNAISLSMEPYYDSPNLWQVLFEVFIAIYLVEAIVKIYAHPIGYWRSAFNIFDFLILIICLFKMLNDWSDITESGVERVFVIFRALRVLRGISLSIELQILLAALVQTVKSHILSVLILLFLLLYVAAIFAYYLFASKSMLLHESWGNVPSGMLRMIVFVTMDGWTEIFDEFEKSDLQTYGRAFNLICIVLGNFLFSNIFIAIIILNISVATDLYKDRLKREKLELVRSKKENVFRRQKLDMRQLLARQRNSASVDFYQLAEQFQLLLRHDDMEKMNDTVTCHLWMDACYKSALKIQHTSTVLVNLHRMMVDNLMNLWRFYKKGRIQIQAIRRGRYNRYMKIKAKLALIKKEILNLRPPPEEPPKGKLKIRLPASSNEAIVRNETRTDSDQDNQLGASSRSNSES